ncbi:uncharacterized protein LOC116116068 [Pistacia vera]|uniref:uncharacterized protein LOC116116068 n=1 Tax=Pistacia vera TaxID=55513 RepID=UPI001263AA03|nr:uncharacterized protein LOC116116068 [Pistacia vera]
MSFAGSGYRRRSSPTMDPNSSAQALEISVTCGGIKLSFSTPRNPQSNDQAESSNKTIIQTLKKRLQKAKGAWADELPEVLWSYRTTARSSMGETLFSLTYGSEAIIPVDVSVPSTRLQWEDEESNDQNLCQNLDTIDELRERASIRNTVYQQQAA